MLLFFSILQVRKISNHILISKNRDMIFDFNTRFLIQIQGPPTGHGEIQGLQTGFPTPGKPPVRGVKLPFSLNLSMIFTKRPDSVFDLLDSDQI